MRAVQAFCIREILPKPPINIFVPQDASAFPVWPANTPFATGCISALTLSALSTGTPESSSDSVSATSPRLVAASSDLAMAAAFGPPAAMVAADSRWRESESASTARVCRLANNFHPHSPARQCPHHNCSLARARWSRFRLVLSTHHSRPLKDGGRGLRACQLGSMGRQ